MEKVPYINFSELVNKVLVDAKIVSQEPYTHIDSEDEKLRGIEAALDTYINAYWKLILETKDRDIDRDRLWIPQLQVDMTVGEVKAADLLSRLEEALIEQLIVEENDRKKRAQDGSQLATLAV